MTPPGPESAAQERDGASPHADSPVVLVWELTQACDLACDHCRADAEPERHPRELTTAEAEGFLEDVRGFGEGQIVVFSGGDPMKRPDAVDLVDHADDLGLTATMTPSGVDGLDRDALERLRDAGLHRLALSLDGASAAGHDGVRGEEGSFAATLRAAEAARDLGVPLQINTTVCRRTVGALPAIADRVAELDAVLWSVFFLVPIGRGAALDGLGPERADAVMRWLHDRERDAPFRVKTTEAPQYRRVAHEATAEGDPAASVPERWGVWAGNGFAFVGHTGDVTPSGFLPRAAGNVREDDVVELYREHPLFERLRRPATFAGECGDCGYRRLCGGSRSRACAATGDPFGSDPLCPHVPRQTREGPATAGGGDG